MMDTHPTTGSSGEPPEKSNLAVLSELAVSPDRAVRRAVAENHACPPEALGGLLLEFPHIVLKNPMLSLAVSANPGLLNAWSDVALALLATSSEGALVAPLLLQRESLVKFMHWWNDRGIAPWGPTDRPIRYKDAPTGMSLDTEQLVRAIAHLSAIAGLASIRGINQFDPIHGGDGYLRVHATDAAAGHETCITDNWWRIVEPLLYIGNGSDASFDITAGVKAIIYEAMKYEIGFDAGPNAHGDLKVTIYLNEDNYADQAFVSLQRWNDATRRAEVLIKNMAGNGVVLWVSSTSIGISVDALPDETGPALLSVVAFPNDAAHELWEMVESDSELLARVIARTVSTTQPSLIDDLTEEGETQFVTINCPEQTAALALVAEELLAASVGHHNAEGSSLSAPEYLGMVFVDGRLARLFGEQAICTESEQEDRVELDEIAFASV